MKLPILTRVNVKNLSLYNGNIDRKLMPGLNMVIGGNGLGKTTFVNTIIYGLIGNTKFKTLNIKTGKTELVELVSSDYFHGRIEPKDQDKAEVTVSYSAGNHTVSVTRQLFRPKITNFSVSSGNKATPKFYDQRTKNLEEIYKSAAEKVFEVEQLEDFAFAIAHLLVFDEERRTLVWDGEVQNKMIRLLFIPNDFDKRFSKQSELVTDYDTKGRHTSESRKEVRRSIESWLEEKKKNEPLPESEFSKNRLALEIQMAKLQATLESLLDDNQTLEEKINAETQIARDLVTELNNVELAKTSVTDQLTELEHEFYSEIYQDIPSQYIILLETLIKDGYCQACGTSHTNLRKIGKELKQNGQCVVCRSPVQYQPAKIERKNQDNLTERINKLRNQLEEIATKEQEYALADATAKKELKRLQDTLGEKTREKRRIDSEILTIKSKLVTQRAKASNDEAERDEWLEAQERRIIELDAEIQKYYDKRDNAKKILNNLNEELIVSLEKVNEELTPLFSHFASKFLGTNCSLVISTKTRASKPVSFMYPRFNDKDRQQSTNVSESQRFFLDQAFRMALIELFTQKQGAPTFYIAETPEGSLDLAYERNVANMYLEFSNSSHSIIITSNLNSSNFLQSLYTVLESQKGSDKRTLDLLKYGKLSEVQKREKESFDERYVQLSIPFK